MVFKFSSRHEDAIKATYEDFFYGIKPDFVVICEVNKPLRSTRELTNSQILANDNVRNGIETYQNVTSLVQLFNWRIDVPSMISSGIGTQEIDSPQNASLEETLKSAWDKVPSSGRGSQPQILYVLDYSFLG